MDNKKKLSFPVEHLHQEGLTKHEWFSGLALMGLLATGQYEYEPAGVSKINAAEEAYEYGERLAKMFD